MKPLRVLIVSHGHPDFSVGGGELAAYAHFRELQRRKIECMFLARVNHSSGHQGTSISHRTPDGREVLFDPPPLDHFRQTQPDKQAIVKDFRDVLERFKPTVVHFHHFFHMGLDIIRETRNSLPRSKIVLTLHEFLAICHAHGQMLKTNGLLCVKSGPVDCHRCFPDISPQDFFMRQLFVQSFFKLCDHFVSPSEFLRQRYVEWGVPYAKIAVVENGQSQRPPEEAVLAPLLRTRFVVLGQLSRLKGTLVVLQAARLLPKALKDMIRIEIHGSMHHESDAFKAQFQRELEELEGVVSYGGPYRPDDVSDIIRQHGWVIQPSIWWENSPLVIQEAFSAGRPVICSNIGGMAEKVTHAASGLHFRVGSASDLASRLQQAAMEPGLWSRLRVGLPTPPTIAATVEAMLGIYKAASHPDRVARQPSLGFETSPSSSNMVR